MTTNPVDPPPPPTSVPPTPDERTWAALAHFLSLLGLLSGIAGWMPPLVVWLVKRDQSAFVEDQAREALNFQITLLILAAIALLLMFTIVLACVAIPAWIVLAVCGIVFACIGGVRANAGETYRYPFCLRLL